jgi:hypothetical protein
LDLSQFWFETGKAARPRSKRWNALYGSIYDLRQPYQSSGPVVGFESGNWEGINGVALGDARVGRKQLLESG